MTERIVVARLPQEDGRELVVSVFDSIGRWFVAVQHHERFVNHADPWPTYHGCSFTAELLDGVIEGLQAAKSEIERGRT